MSFSDLIDNALLPMAAGPRAAIATAFEDFQEVVDGQMAAFLGAPERARFQEQLAALGRELAVSMRPGTQNIGNALLTQDGLVLITEGGEAILTES